MHPAFERMYQKLANRLRTFVARGVIELVNDTAKLQELQISLLADEVVDGVERFQQYGFTSHPKPGAECLAISLGGKRDHTIVVAVDDRRYRLQLVEGEAALYDDLGQKVHLARTGMDIVSPLQVNITAPVINVIGALNVTGAVSITGSLGVTGGGITGDTVADADGDLGEMRGVYNTHTHTAPAGGGATTVPSSTMS